jgi:hypothetical protein
MEELRYYTSEIRDKKSEIIIISPMTNPFHYITFIITAHHNPPSQSITSHYHQIHYPQHNHNHNHNHISSHRITSSHHITSHHITAYTHHIISPKTPHHITSTSHRTTHSPTYYYHTVVFICYYHF